MARAGWGKAKREVLALKREIINLCEQGANLDEVFRQFLADKKLTVSRTTFFLHAKTLREEALGQVVAPAAPSISPTPIPITPKTNAAASPQPPQQRTPVGTAIGEGTTLGKSNFASGLNKNADDVW